MTDERHPDTSYDTPTGRPASSSPGACVSCGSPSAQAWDTGDGRVAMCGPCAVMHDIGCP